MVGRDRPFYVRSSAILRAARPLPAAAQKRDREHRNRGLMSVCIHPTTEGNTCPSYNQLYWNGSILVNPFAAANGRLALEQNGQILALLRRQRLGAFDDFRFRRELGWLAAKNKAIRFFAERLDQGLGVRADHF